MATELPLTNLPGILRLSPETRRRIYLRAGLGPRWYYADEESPRMYDLADLSGLRAMKLRYSYDEQSFYSLLLSCRTIYSEVSALLYSTHWFIIHHRTRQTLQPLRALTPHALASLTSLKIVLNQTSCHQQQHGHEGDGGCCSIISAQGSDPAARAIGFTSNSCCLVWHQDEHDSHLERSTLSAEEMLGDWHAAAAHLASYIAPGKLELALVCDIPRDDVETAERVLASLHLLPLLKNCHVRLCGTQDTRLQELAQAAVLRARGIASSESPSVLNSSSPRLINLPRELRLRILEYTDLIAPWKEVTWSRDKRGYYREAVEPCFSAEGSGRCSPEFHHGCQFGDCSSRSSWPELSLGCFCIRRHTAFSSRCRCWAPPTRLFLVCRTLYLDANVVFYSGNRFIVIDGPSSNPFVPWAPGNYPHESLAASHFLHHIVPRHCLGYIRFLELVFAPFTHLSRPRDEHPALEDWAETLDWVKDKLNLPALTLRMIMAGNRGFRPDGSLEMTRAQGKEVGATHIRIISPLQRLGAATDNGLARFYAELHWPWLWTEWVGEKLKEESRREWLQSKHRELKTRAERAIMGERYRGVDSVVGEPHRSVWNWSCPRHY